MELTPLERMALLSILPKEGDFLTLKRLRELKESLVFTDEEIFDKQVVQVEGGGIQWSDMPDCNQPAEIPIGEIMNDLIVKTLKQLDSQRKLTEQTVGIYERFVAE